MDNLEYAEMLEIPVNTVNVVKKRGFFRRRSAAGREDLKDDVVADVNSRIEETGDEPRADFIQTEDLSEPPVAGTKVRDGWGTVLVAEAVAACLLAGGIFLTNALVDNTAIEVSQTAGVISFTGNTAVYPVCDGKIVSVASADGLYTVEIEHSPAFTSVFTGLSEVYSAAGDEVRANIPFARSDGQNEVRVSMYDGDALIDGYTLSGAVPVWNS